MEITRDDIQQMFRAEAERLLQEHSALRPLMSVKDVARTLDVSPRTVENLIGEGEIRPLWIGKQRKFHPDAIDAYVRAKST